jgi:mannitol-1-phosphate/altronate dehydrogenase
LGEGNFLRAFVDWQIDLLNEHTDLNAGIVVVRPISRLTDRINRASLTASPCSLRPRIMVV